MGFIMTRNRRWEMLALVAGLMLQPAIWASPTGADKPSRTVEKSAKPAPKTAQKTSRTTTARDTQPTERPVDPLQAPVSPVQAAGTPSRRAPPAMDKPQVWGYGVKGCAEFLRLPAPRAGAPGAVEEQGRYEDWLTGLVTGLSLATAEDVLHGLTMGKALERIQGHCREHPSDDFFRASMELIRQLSVP
jgi:hypothetical protein